MARKRMEEPDLKCWEDADIVLKKIRENELEISGISAQAEKEIMQIKAMADSLASPLKDEIKRLELQLKEFTTLNRDELKGKTKEMTFGKVGFRFSTKVVLPKAADKVIRALKKAGMGDCITVKESVNKDILKTYNENAILTVGASLKKEDTFWYETKQEEVATTQ